jgi:hypothetical protein
VPSNPAPFSTRRPRPLAKLAFAAALLFAGLARGEALEDGDILVTDFSADKLWVIDNGTGATSALATAGFVLDPVGVAVREDGFAYLTNVASQLIVRVDPAAVGSPTIPVQVLIGSMPNARGIVISQDGNAYVSSPTTDEILLVDLVTGVSKPVSASGLIHFPTGLVREPNGDLVVADSGTLGSRIFRIHPADGVQTQLAGDTTLTINAAPFQVLRDIVIDPAADCSTPAACRFLVVDSGARKVFQVDAAIPYDPATPNANVVPWAECAAFQGPRGIAVEASGSVLVSDFTAKKVFRIQPTAPPRLCTEVPTGSNLVGAWDVTVARAITPFAPGPLLVADSGPPAQALRVAGTATGTGAPIAGSAGIAGPVAVIRSLTDDLFVLTSDRIFRLTPGGAQTEITAFTAPVNLSGIAIDADGEILVTDAANHRLVRVIPGTGEKIVVSDGSGTPPGPLADPAGLVLDRNGTVLVANRGRSDVTPAIPTGIVRVNPASGTTSVAALDEQFGKLVGIAVDSNGDYLIADEANDTVWRKRTSTPANSLVYAVSIGNDIVLLRGIAVDVNRSVLVSNQGPKEILRLDPVSGVQSEVAASVVFTQIQGIALDQSPDPAPLDSDNDGLLEVDDNCPEAANPNQADLDEDGVGDVCDNDVDGDGDLNTADNCSIIANADQIDTNQEGFGNRCDPDYDNNGAVNAVDFSRFRNAYLKAVGDPAYEAAIDADSDGVIGPADFAVFKDFFLKAPGPSGYSCAGGTPPCPAPSP